MPPLRKAVLAGAAVIALAGIAGLAAAKTNNFHILDVPLPDGGLAHIRYVGDTPPTVSFAPAPVTLSGVSPAAELFGPDSPFAALERISAAMDRQAAAMFDEAAIQPGPALDDPGLMRVDVSRLPPGAEGFSMVSTISGDGACTRSVEYRSLGDGRPPQVVTRTSGACGGGRGEAATSATSRQSGAGSDLVRVSDVR